MYGAPDWPEPRTVYRDLDVLYAQGGQLTVAHRGGVTGVSLWARLWVNRGRDAGLDVEQEEYLSRYVWPYAYIQDRALWMGADAVRCYGIVGSPTESRVRRLAEQAQRRSVADVLVRWGRYDSETFIVEGEP